MKPTLLTLLIVCAHLLLAQSPTGTAVVTGTLSQPVDRLLSLRDAAPFALAHPIVEGTIGPSGNFWLEWELRAPRLVYLHHAGQRLLLFLRPGEKVVLQAEADRLATQARIAEAALGMADNQALVRYHRQLADLPTLQEQLSRVRSLPAHMRILRAYQRKAEQVWQSLRDTATQSQPFVAYMDSRAAHLSQALTLQGPAAIALRNGQDPNALVLPDNLILTPTPAQLNRPELLYSPEYGLFVTAYIDYLIAQKGVKPTDPEQIDRQFQLLSATLQDSVLTYGVAYVLDRVFRSRYPAVAERYYRDFPQLPGRIPTCPISSPCMRPACDWHPERKPPPSALPTRLVTRSN